VGLMVGLMVGILVGFGVKGKNVGIAVGSRVRVGNIVRCDVGVFVTCTVGGTLDGFFVMLGLVGPFVFVGNV
jgi:hypothetical protein